MGRSPLKGKRIDFGSPRRPLPSKRTLPEREPKRKAPRPTPQRSPVGAASMALHPPTPARREVAPTSRPSPPPGTARVTSPGGTVVDVPAPEQLTFRMTFSIPLDDLDGPVTGLMNEEDFARYQEMYPDDEELVVPPLMPAFWDSLCPPSPGPSGGFFGSDSFSPSE
ncbi:PREDICTED: lysine-rich arabinogalactan protein 18-like [Ipomoea nil]|uniref:lysine-rich arabinogalactan protein 18-like n=1 Tax=Ipomoea nil TaxID=35883 RepID=UPI0009010A46|nr:PREDICTED: lysine-rich arabinogalactan protein 18-like [Ipomoea nil]